MNNKPPASSGDPLAIARVFAERDGVTFRSEGTCMYPTIRPGDLLRIQSRGAAEVRVGDIAVCRRNNHLFSHRVVDLGEDHGRPFVVTRPDRVHHGGDPPAFDEDLLGVVVEIERRGRFVSLVPAVAPWPLRLYYAACLKTREIRLRGRLWSSGIATRLRDTRPYQRMVQVRVRLQRPQFTYSVRVPVPALGDTVFRQMTPEAFNTEKDWRGRPVQRWTLAMHLDGETQPVAWMKFARGATDIWTVEGSFVQDRWRGAGLEVRLQNRAQEILPRAAGRMTGSAGERTDEHPTGGPAPIPRLGAESRHGL